MLKPKWTLRLSVPLGGKKGMFQWEMFIMLLYPWISIVEDSSDEIAISLATPGQETSMKQEDPTKQKGSVEQAEQPSRETQAPEKAVKKKSFWKRLFG